MLVKKNWNHQNFDQLLKRPSRNNVIQIKSKGRKYDLLSDFIGKDAYLYAQNHIDFPEVEILNDRIPQQLKEIIKTCKQQKDNRSDLNYAKGVVYNWTLEANVRERMMKKGLKVDRNGVDKNFKFVKGHEISSDPDFIINDELFEMVADYNGHWLSKGELDLRCYKFDNVVKHNAKLLAIDVKNRKWAIIEPTQVRTEKMKKHPQWEKPATRLFIPDVEWFSIDDMDLDFYYFNKKKYFN